jgi:ribosomal protein S27AE
MQFPLLSDATYARMGVPEQPQYAPPVRVDAGPVQAYVCMKCGAVVASQQQRAASQRWGCGACKGG